MLIRNGWVSNSSSSSYIVNADLTEWGIMCWRIPKEWYIEFEKYAEASKLDSDPEIKLEADKDYWLTEMFEFWGSDPEEQVNAFNKAMVCYFDNGQMCGEPYDEEQYAVMATDDFGTKNVYVHKELLAKCGPPLTASEVAAKLTERYGDSAQFGIIPQEDRNKVVVFLKEDPDAEQTEE